MASAPCEIANYRVVGMDCADEVAADMGVSLLAVFNALRLLGGGTDGKNAT